MGRFRDWLVLENTAGVLRAYANVDRPPQTPAAELQADPEIMRYLAMELAFAYEDAEDETDRKAILQHMAKLPMVMQGRVGEVVPFDGLEMQAQDMANVNEPVRVVRPSFLLMNGAFPYRCGPRVLVTAAPGARPSGKLSEIPLGRKETAESPETTTLKRNIELTKQKIRQERNAGRKAALQQVLAQYERQLSS